MNLTAVVVGLECLKRPVRVAVEVSRDEDYLRGGISRWLPRWRHGAWSAEEQPDRDVDLWQRLASVVEQHDVEWVPVNGRPPEERVLA